MFLQKSAVIRKVPGRNAIPRLTRDRERWRWKRATKRAANRPRPCRRSAKKVRYLLYTIGLLFHSS